MVRSQLLPAQDQCLSRHLRTRRPPAKRVRASGAKLPFTYHNAQVGFGSACAVLRAKLDGRKGSSLVLLRGYQASGFHH